MKTTLAPTQDVARQWYLVNAQGQILGRLATRLARILSGRNKPSYVPHIDGGDFVVVVNASQLRVTGKKLTDKIYYHHSFYPGGLKKRTLGDLLARQPERVLTLAVKRMLPKNRLAARRLKRLLVYATETHPHEAQRPQEIKL